MFAGDLFEFNADSMARKIESFGINFAMSLGKNVHQKLDLDFKNNVRSRSIHS